MSKLKEYFNERTSEQILSLCLLIGVVVTMLFCAIVRLCGGLWFSADLDKVKEPSPLLQEIIKGLLLFIEMIFVYKILCRKSWLICGIISTVYVIVGILLGEIFGNYIVSNVYYMLTYILLPIIFVRHWFVLIESILLYGLSMLYCIIFAVGRIGKVEINMGYAFIYSILSAIDYKLFVISIYLFIKNFGGIKLWKKQKRLLFQKCLSSKE